MKKVLSQIKAFLVSIDLSTVNDRSEIEYLIQLMDWIILGRIEITPENLNYIKDAIKTIQEVDNIDLSMCIELLTTEKLNV